MKRFLTVFIVFFLVFHGFTHAQNGGQPRVHTVQKGETLFSIARAFQVTISDLKKWNGLVDETIWIGQTLQVEAPRLPPLMDYKRSQQYADSIMYARVRVHNNCLFNVSGELQYYIIPYYWDTGQWRGLVRQFYNTPAELDYYLGLFRELNAILVKTKLENKDPNKITTLYQLIWQFEKYKMAIMNTQGNYQDFSRIEKGSSQQISLEVPNTTSTTPASTTSAPATSAPTNPTATPYSSYSPIYLNVNIIAVCQSNHQPLPNSKVYALLSSRLTDPEQLLCLTSNCLQCDFSQLNIYSSDLVDGNFYAAAYHILVTVKQAGIERIVYFEQRTIKKTDDGTTVQLPVQGF